MRKIVLSGIAALGFLAIGMTVIGHHGAMQQANGDGGGADVRMTRHTMVAMIDQNHAGRVQLVASDAYAGHAHSLLVAEAEGSGADVRMTRHTMVALNLFQTADTGTV